jgi:hypothetical protein
MAYKEDWFKGASYVYKIHRAMAQNGEGTIAFDIPNAAGGPLHWEVWLYRYKNGVIVDTNLTAHMLQCYIDRELSK